MSKSLSFISNSITKSLPLLYPSTSASIVSSVRHESTTSTRHQSTGILPPLVGQFPTAERVLEKKKSIDGPFALVDNSVGEQIKKPMVVMLGWGGCTDKQLSRFSEMWLEKGYSVVRYSAPMDKVTNLYDYPQFVGPLYSEIARNLADRQILLHLFSMNGCNTYVTLFNLLNKSTEGKKVISSIKGMIVDSGPADVTPKATALAVALSTYPPGRKDFTYIASRSVLYAFLTARLYGQRLDAWVRDLLGQNSYAERFAYYKMKQIKKQLPSKQMYFYSNKDFVCTADSVEKFIEGQGPEVEVKKFKFEDSAHVSHFRKHPELYRKECERFAEEALRM